LSEVDIVGMGGNYQNPGNLSIIDHAKNRTARDPAAMPPPGNRIGGAWPLR
jgi:hypothetical protein